MLRSMKDLEHYAIGATDGTIGHVKDFLFDDHAWVVRYFVVETGSWLSSRKVLISPIAVQVPNWLKKVLPVRLTMERVRNSPDVDTDKPVSRQYETEYLGYYGFPYYWGGEGLWGGGMFPYAMYPGYVEDDGLHAENRVFERAKRIRHMHDDPHLRSCDEVIGYHISARDGEVGHVAGLLVDEQTWSIRYLVVDTTNWWGGQKVLIAPEWIDKVDWPGRTVSIDLTRQAVKDAPGYETADQLNRQFEARLYNHHRRSGYWTEEVEPKRAVTES